jgi:CHAT domain-containing protein
MRIFYVFLLLIVGVNPVIGQVGLDTLGLTGTMADTVVGKKLYNLAFELINNEQYQDAYFIADSSERIYTNIYKKECKQVANAIHVKGASKFHLNLFDEAIDLYKASLEIRLKISGPLHEKTGALYYDIANAYKYKGEYKTSIEMFENSLQIYIKNSGYENISVAEIYIHLSNINQDLGKYGLSIGYTKKAMEIASKIFDPESELVATCLNDLGVICSNLGEYHEALEYYEKSLDIRKKILEETNTDIAASYINMGSVHEKMGDHDKAIYYAKVALKIFQKSATPQPKYIAYSYNNIGNAFSSKGDFEKATIYYEKAIQITISEFNDSHPDLASYYMDLGIVFFSKGEYNKCQFYFQKALDIRLKALGVDNDLVAHCYGAIGVALNSEKKYDRSIEFEKKSIEILERNYEETHPELANAYLNIGTSFEAKGEHENALEYYIKSLHIFSKIYGTKHPYVAGNFYNLGELYANKNNFEKAIELFEKALNSSGYEYFKFKNINSFEHVTETLRAMSHSYLRIYQDSLNSPNLSKSYSTITQALAALIYQQSTLQEESSKSFNLSQNYPIYEQAISVSLLKAEVDQNNTLRHNTFHYAEKSKASQLQAQIKSADAINFAGIPDSLLQKEHDLRIDITWRERQRQTFLDQGLTEIDTNTLRISSILFDLKNNYEALKKRFETQYPEYYRLKYDLSTVSLQYVQDTLLQPKNQALLEYFVGDSSIYLFVIRPDTLIVQEVKRDFPLEDWIEKFRQGLYGYYTADKGKRDTALFNSTVRQYTDYGQKLYKKFFAPVEQWLPKQVIIVPDGPLGFVPFDALLTSKPEDPLDFKSYPYLLNKYQFSYTYSATLLKEMRDKKHHHEPVKEFAAFAPFYNGDTTLLAGMYQYDDLMRKDLQPLAYSGPEVAAASKLMRGEIVAGPAATEERFTSTAGDYRILHLATHGRADNRVGDYAFLAFSELKDSVENELLYVKDLYNLELNADLVVLSACETGIGKLQRGEGIISLARAFAYAGAKSIVTTLWEVNDKSTSELMRYFYRELKLGKDKDEALRLARQRYFDKAAPRGLHPFFWAAFVPVGDMRPVR